MSHSFVPLVLLGLLPAIYFAGAAGLLGRRAVRGGLVVAGAMICGLAIYDGGLDFAVLKRIKLGVAAAAAALLILRPLAARGAPRRTWPALLALVAWIVNFNFFDFHGARTYVHVHDVAHYYLGGKYFTELGYGDLYVAMLRAEAELHDNHFKSVEARDRVRLAVLFGAEAVGYTLLLFEPSDVIAYFHYNVLILYVLIAMYLPVFSNDERQINPNPRDGAPSRIDATGALVAPGTRC